MRSLGRAFVVAVALSLLAPAALAAPGEAQILGRAHVDADAAALFALASDGAFAWSATASSVVVERTFTNYSTVQGPYGGPVSVYGDPARATEVYGASVLVSTRAGADGALLAEPASGALQLAGDHPTGLRLASVADPKLDQGAAQDLREGDEATYTIHATYPGSFVLLDAPGGAIEARGTFTLRLYDVDYAIRSEAASASERTGKLSDYATAGASTGRVEAQRVTLVDGVLRLQAAGAKVLAAAPVLRFDGTLVTEGSDASRLGLDAAGPGRYQGAAVLTAKPDGGALDLLAASAQAPGRALLPGATAASLFLPLVVGVLALIGATAWWLTRRARRFDDDLGEALLAMEEKRYADALAPLERARLRRPHDPLVNLDLALCLDESGRLDEAKAQYEATLALAPANAEALYYYARCLARLCLGPESEAHLAEALVLDPRLEEMARRESAFRGFTGVAR